jgi:UDP-N-acetylmuramate dehydrogenase
MQILENASLAPYTTFKMGGTATKLYIPETVDEMAALAAENSDVLRYVLGGGSNLIINDSKVFDQVLCLLHFNDRIEKKPNGQYYIGASVRLQNAIKTINENGCGGIEYLYSVPGLVGGALYMNAGRGKAHHQAIGDYVVSVDYWQAGGFHTLAKAACGFAYRKSIFQQMQGAIITGAVFAFPEMPQAETQARVQERLALCKRTQDMSCPNVGTVFCQSNKYIMALVKQLHMGYPDGVAFSPKTKNWLLRRKAGTFAQAVKLIGRVQKMHRLLGQKITAEVKMWE